MRVLVVEDDPRTSQAVQLILERAQFIVDSTDLGEDGISLAKVYDYDIILLDLGLPDMNGQDALRKIRRSGVATPILILTGADDPQNKLVGLNNGADDYLTKPFDQKELIARMHAIIRRSKGFSKSIIDIGPLQIDTEAKSLTINGDVVYLTSREYSMLELLAMRRNITITKESFMAHLYGGMDEPEIKIIDVFMCKLRKKIADASDGYSPIETVWGRGYVLRDTNTPIKEREIA